MTILVDVPKNDEAHEIHSNVWAQLKDKLVFKPAKGSGKYNVSKKIALDSTISQEKWPFFQYRYEDGAAMQFRLELSPVDLDCVGLEELHAILVSVMPGGWAFVLKHGRVTKIEVSVDLPGIDVNSIHALPKQVATARSWGSNGKLETLTLGKPKGNQWRIYDRGKKRKVKGQSDPDYEGTRIERVLRKIGLHPLIDLPKMENPFTDLRLVIGPQAKPPGEAKDVLWNLFMDAVEVRTLAVALKLLPVKQRTRYRAWFSEHPVDWWKPDLIWARWEDELDKLNIVNPAKWW